MSYFLRVIALWKHNDETTLYQRRVPGREKSYFTNVVVCLTGGTIRGNITSL